MEMSIQTASIYRDLNVEGHWFENTLHSDSNMGLTVDKKATGSLALSSSFTLLNSINVLRQHFQSCFLNAGFSASGLQAGAQDLECVSAESVVGGYVTRISPAVGEAHEHRVCQRRFHFQALGDRGVDFRVHRRKRHVADAQDADLDVHVWAIRIGSRLAFAAGIGARSARTGNSFLCSGDPHFAICGRCTMNNAQDLFGQNDASASMNLSISSAALALSGTYHGGPPYIGLHFLRMSGCPEYSWPPRRSMAAAEALRYNGF